MIERQIQFKNAGGVIESVNIKLPENWREVTVNQVSRFMNCIKTYEDYQAQIEQMPLPNQLNEGKMRALVFHADMVSCMTGIHNKFIERLSADVILKLSADLAFTKTAPNDKPLRKVVWRNRTLASLNQMKLSYEKKSSIKNAKSKLALKAKIEISQNTTYEVSKEIGHISLEQWIQSNKLGKEIRKIIEEMKKDDYSRLAELMSYVLVEKGKGYSVKRQKKNVKIFGELPFEDAFRVSSFFLSMQTSLLKGLKTFITTRMVAAKENQKLKVKNS